MACDCEFCKNGGGVHPLGWKGMTPEEIRWIEWQMVIDEANKWTKRGWLVSVWRTNRSKYHPLGGWVHLVRVKGDQWRHVVADCRNGRRRWKTSMATRGGLDKSGAKGKVLALRKLQKGGKDGTFNG